VQVDARVRQGHSLNHFIPHFPNMFVLILLWPIGARFISAGKRSCVHYRSATVHVLDKSTKKGLYACAVSSALPLVRDAAMFTVLPSNVLNAPAPCTISDATAEAS
jgi:hypothetical protein